jgi:group I intron endonuclease
MPWTIYCHIHIDSGRRYIGLTSQTVEKRWNQHCVQAKSSKGGRWHFPNAIRQYGKNAFSHEVLEVCETLESANEAEAKWIDHFDSRNPERGFNLAKGGEHVPHPIKNPWDRPGYREKAIRSLKNTWSDPKKRAEASVISKTALNKPEVRKRCSDVQKGKVFGLDHRAKISKNMIALNASKSKEELARISRLAREGKRIHSELMTDEEKREAFNNRSRASKQYGKASALQTLEARARHDEACASRTSLDQEKIIFAMGLLNIGYSFSDVGWLLGVSKDTIRYYHRKHGRRPLAEHLLYASEIVKTWPIWKQNCLGNLNEACSDK